MEQEGMKGSLDFDVGDFLDKAFITFRKTKNVNETLYNYRYSFLNFITHHYTRNANDIYSEFRKVELTKRIYHARPSVILNIDNEYLTFRLMDDIKGIS
jgi:5-methylthioribose kinase